MEKVKLTPEQANAIKKWINKEQLIIAKASGFFEHGMDEPIAELTMEQLVKALYIGYEVEPEFKVGDWVSFENGTHGLVTRKIETFDYSDYWEEEVAKWQTGSMPISRIRPATPSEIAEEKERRWWAKHGRDVWELRKGDVLY